MAERHAGIVRAHHDLITLRTNGTGLSRGLTGGNTNLIHLDEENKVIAYHRWANGGPMDDTVVVINFGNKMHPNYVLGLPRDGVWKIRFNSTLDGYSPDFKDILVTDIAVTNGGGTIVLPPGAALILSQDS
jgi:1,4-alpha-glucan branching enzyme